jgi:hypothetical protein
MCAICPAHLILLHMVTQMIFVVRNLFLLYPCSRSCRPIGLLDVEMAVRLSALRAGRPLPPRKILILISVRG